MERACPRGDKMRILGVDPGSRLTGWGCIDVEPEKRRFRLVAHGTLQVGKLSGVSAPLDQRLLLIHQGLTQVIEQHRPQIVSVEKVFFAKNVLSALKLGQARGAAILVAAIHSLEVFEYSATEVKAALTGYGQSQKEQVARMLETLFGKQQFDSPDASDALALAVCHALQMPLSGAAQGPLKEELARAFKGRGKSGKRRKLSLAEAVGLK